MGHLPHVGPNEMMTKSKGNTFFVVFLKTSQTSSTVLHPLGFVGNFVGCALEMEDELDVFKDLLPAYK